MPECVFVGLVSYSNMIPAVLLRRHGAQLEPPENLSRAWLLYPRFGSYRLVYRDGIRTIQEPDASHELEQTYDTATRTPREQARRNLRGIDQRQTDQDDHD